MAQRQLPASNRRSRDGGVPHLAMDNRGHRRRRDGQRHHLAVLVARVHLGGGAVLLVALGLLPAADALAGAAEGTSVYLFLIGMMLLAEFKREQGLFARHGSRTAPPPACSR
jgi:hypothetical protein